MVVQRHLVGRTPVDVELGVRSNALKILMRVIAVGTRVVGRPHERGISRPHLARWSQEAHRSALVLSSHDVPLGGICEQRESVDARETQSSCFCGAVGSFGHDRTAAAWYAADEQMQCAVTKDGDATGSGASLK